MKHLNASTAIHLNRLFFSFNISASIMIFILIDRDSDTFVYDSAGIVKGPAENCDRIV